MPSLLIFREGMAALQAEILRKKQHLAKVSPGKASPKETEPTTPVYSRVKLRKTGVKLTDERETSTGWEWLFACCAWPYSSDEEMPVAAKVSRQRILCDICNLPIYAAYERYDYGGGKYHKACFRCAGCNQSLASNGVVKHERGGSYYCSTCVTKAHEKYRQAKAEHVVGETQEQAGLRKTPSHRGDVEGVMNAIGDDLEEAYRRQVVTCEICGGTMDLKRDDIYYETRGDKYVPVAHAECRKLGRPRDGVVYSAEPPRLAIKKVPDQLVVKFLAPNAKALTIFLKKIADTTPKTQRKHTKEENEAPAAVAYSPVDPDKDTAATKKQRRAHLATLLAAAKLDVKVAADDYKLATNQPPRTTVASKSMRVVVLEAIKARLHYELRIDFEIVSKPPKSEEARPSTAKLTIAIPKRGANRA